MNRSHIERSASIQSRVQAIRPGLRKFVSDKFPTLRNVQMGPAENENWNQFDNFSDWRQWDNH